MAANGRLVIPANVRAQLGMPNGGTFVVEVQDGQIRLEPLAATVARAQAIVRRYVPAATSLVGELTDDRRHAADRE